MSKGKIIVLEGMDGCGKGTQTQLLLKYLKQRKIPFCAVSEPGNTNDRERLRHILMHSSYLRLSPLNCFYLFNTDRRLAYVHEIIPALQREELIIQDRNFISSLVYQGIVGGVDIETIITETQRVSEGCLPDLTLILDINDIEGAVKRARGVSSQQGHDLDTFEERSIKYHTEISNAYRVLPSLLLGRDLSKEVELIPEATIDQTHEQIKTYVDPILGLWIFFLIKPIQKILLNKKDNFSI